MDRENKANMDLPSAIEAIRPCVVQISFSAVHLSDTARASVGGQHFVHHPLGTGFFVTEDGHVLTAKHVIDGARRALASFDAGDKSVLVSVAQPNDETFRANFSGTTFDVVAEDDRNDLALLRVHANPFRGELNSGIQIGTRKVELLSGVTVMTSDRPSDGEHVAVSGYPLANPVLVTSAGGLASAWAYDLGQEWMPSGYGFTMDPVDRFLADVEVNSGNSGGPVYRIADGCVIGVCVATQQASVMAGDAPAELEGRRLTYSSGLTVVIPLKYGFALIERNS